MPVTLPFRHLTLALSSPYTPGQHRLTAVEAGILNLARARRCRDNLKTTINSFLDAKRPMEDLNARIESYDRQFTLNSAPEIGTLEYELQRLAAALLAEDARRLGLPLEQEPEQKELLELMDRADVVEEARRRFEIKQSVARSALEELL